MNTTEIVTANAPRSKVDASLRRHAESNGPGAEHYNITVNDCVGCEWRFANSEVAAIRRENGNRRATLYRTGNTFVAIDLDAPFTDIVDSLFHAGMDSDRAEEEASRLVNQ